MKHYKLQLHDEPLTREQFDAFIADRVWPKDHVRWAGSIRPERYQQNGYYVSRRPPQPILTVNKHEIRVSRHLWNLMLGFELPPGIQVRHACDDPTCVNPIHHRLVPVIDRMLEEPKALVPVGYFDVMDANGVDP